MKNFLKLEMIVIAAIGVFSATFFIMSFTYGRTAALFPRIVSGFILILVLNYLAGNILSRNKKFDVQVDEPASKEGISPKHGSKWLIFLAGMITYALLMYFIGFVLATFVYSAAVPYLGGYRKTGVIIPFAVVMAVVMFSAGKIFMIPLPTGVLGITF